MTKTRPKKKFECFDSICLISSADASPPNVPYSTCIGKSPCLISSTPSS